MTYKLSVKSQQQLRILGTIPLTIMMRWYCCYGYSQRVAAVQLHHHTVSIEVHRARHRVAMIIECLHGEQSNTK